MSEELRVRKIKNGTVIDHIPSGRSLAVLRILGIKGDEGLVVAIVMNVESRKLGRKDIVKIEDRELSQEEVNKIALIAPTATINIIRNYEVVKKYRVSLPNEIVNLVRCVNPTCITNKPNEPIKPLFTVVSRNPVKLQCTYCGTYINYNDILLQLAGRK
ncbi:MAG: aspartate carbamoyltransferase regulatory subunit [Candidatus Njordarchaeales archaeon]